MDDTPAWIAAARAQWQWTGHARPPFAETPGPGQVSVWDFPRPPRLEPDTREVVVRWGDVDIARTRRAIRLLETAHPPSFYIPWDDVARHHLQPGLGLAVGAAPAERITEEKFLVIGHAERFENQ